MNTCSEADQGSDRVVEWVSQWVSGESIIQWLTITQWRNVMYPKNGIPKHTAAKNSKLTDM